ncbi:hypothetical protein IW136_004681, partial [Coemansia sp. RSA 678]
KFNVLAGKYAILSHTVGKKHASLLKELAVVPQTQPNGIHEQNIMSVLLRTKLAPEIEKEEENIWAQVESESQQDQHHELLAVTAMGSFNSLRKTHADRVQQLLAAALESKPVEPLAAPSETEAEATDKPVSLEDILAFTSYCWYVCFVDADVVFTTNTLPGLRFGQGHSAGMPDWVAGWTAFMSTVKRTYNPPRMDSRVEQSAFDELPFVFQARIRDIELELDEGEITQKGFDKRYASIMQEYQASVHESRREPIAGNGHKAHTNGMTSVRNPGEIGTTVEFEEPTPRVRNGSKKAAYDARKSTVVGFKKPGINFEALLDDLEADSDDPELQPLSKYAGAEASGHSSSASSMSHFPFSLGSPLQPAPPVPDLPRSTRAPYSSSSRIRTDDDDRFDMELSSGRAYNVLSDMMDPYGAQTARSDQQLYSDDSSNNSMLDIDGLGPTEFNPDIITQGAVMRPDESSAASIDTESATPSIEVKRMNSLMYPRRRHSPPAAATMPHHADLPRQISRQNNSRDVPAESADSHPISVTSDNAIPYDADVAAPAETPQLLI